MGGRCLTGEMVFLDTALLCLAWACVLYGVFCVCKNLQARAGTATAFVTTRSPDPWSHSRTSQTASQTPAVPRTGSYTFRPRCLLGACTSDSHSSETLIHTARRHHDDNRRSKQQIPRTGRLGYIPMDDNGRVYIAVSGKRQVGIRRHVMNANTKTNHTRHRGRRKRHDSRCKKIALALFSNLHGRVRQCGAVVDKQRHVGRRRREERHAHLVQTRFGRGDVVPTGAPPHACHTTQCCLHGVGTGSTSIQEHV